jgi:hypothetical protein
LLFQVESSFHLFGEKAQQCHAAKRDPSYKRARSHQIRSSVSLDRDQIETEAGAWSVNSR